MLIDKLIERDQIKLEKLEHEKGVYYILLSRGEKKVLITFTYNGYPVNLTTAFILSLWLMGAYSAEHMTYKGWCAKFHHDPESVRAKIYYEMTKREAQDMHALLGPFYDEYIQLLIDDHFINPICDKCKENPGEQKSFFTRSTGDISYYVCSPLCEEQIIDDILNKRGPKKKVTVP